MIEREWYVQMQLLWKLKSYLQLILGPNLTKSFVRESHNLLLVSNDHVLLGWNWKVFIFLTVNNYQLSKIKTETPINKCRLPKQANHMQLYLFSYYGTTLPDYNILCSIENFRQLSESIDWFCPNVWSFCVGVTVL